MSLDLVCFAVAAVFALVGAIGGLWGGLAHLLAVAGGLAAGLAASEPLGSALAARLRWPVPAAQAVSLVIVFFAVGLAGHWLLIKLTRRFREGEKSAFSRLLGAVLGFASGATMALVAVSGATFMEEPIPGFSDKMRFETAKSSMADLARRYHPLLRTWDIVPTLRRVIRAAGDSKAAEQAKSIPALGVLIADPRVQALLKDKSVKRAVEAGDDLALLRRPEVLQLLTDQDVLVKLSRISEQAEQ